MESLGGPKNNIEIRLSPRNMFEATKWFRSKLIMKEKVKKPTKNEILLADSLVNDFPLLSRKLERGQSPISYK